MAESAQNTPEYHVGLAKAALDSDQVDEAIRQIGRALAFDPRNPGFLEILGVAVSKLPDPLAVLRLDTPDADLTTAIARAFVLEKQGALPDAVALLTDVAVRQPAVPFLLWAAHWLKFAGRVEELPIDRLKGQILPALIQLAETAEHPTTEDDPRWQNLQAACDIVQIVKRDLDPDPMLLYTSALCYRALGHWKHAVFDASQAFQMDQSWAHAIGVACAYRDAEELDNAASWFDYAYKMNPADPRPQLDAARCLTDVGKYDEALAAFVNVLQAQPDNQQAQALKHRALFKKTGDKGEKQAIFEIALRWPEAWAVLNELEGVPEYTTMLPPPVEISARLLTNVIRNPGPAPAGGKPELLLVELPFPEAPSVLTGFRIWRAAQGVPMEVECKVEAVQTPDPREPKAAVTNVLWRYDDFLAHPNATPPDAPVLAAVTEIAAIPFYLEAWAERAGKAAAAFGPAAGPQLLGAMVFPPMPPAPGLDPFFWVRKCQIAAALMLAQVDDGWVGSMRKALLWEVAVGPVDWAVDAVLVALGWLGHEDESKAGDILPLFAWLEGTIPADGHTCFEYPLVCTWLRMPGVDDTTRARLEERKAVYERKHFARS